MDAYAWRFPGLERYYPGSLVPGLHDIGTPVINDWGPLYPRNGFVDQPDDAKAAAVDALRASSIVTQMGQAHVYWPLSNSCGDHCSILPVKENSTNAEYQMIYPKVETHCVVFGKAHHFTGKPWESDARQAGKDRYVWVLWRHYQGCIPDHSGIYLGSMNF
jgi:integrating conjugative element protein (TIGR03756 family)